jgi:hypothetical protein
MNNGLEFKELNPPESRRRYIFPNGTVELFNVTRVCVRPSGSHRVEADGKKYIIPAGWIGIEFEADSWTF